MHDQLKERELTPTCDSLLHGAMLGLVDILKLVLLAGLPLSQADALECRLRQSDALRVDQTSVLLKTYGMWPNQRGARLDNLDTQVPLGGGEQAFQPRRFPVLRRQKSLPLEPRQGQDQPNSGASATKPA